MEKQQAATAFLIVGIVFYFLFVYPAVQVMLLG